VKHESLAIRAAIFFVFLLALAFPALAANTSLPWLYINDVQNPGPSIVTRENTVSIQVYDPGVQHVLKVGGKEAKECATGDYRLENYLLKSGLNSITVSDTVSGKTYKNTYSITYIDEALPGASYYAEKIPANGAISAINKTLSLKFPQNNYIISIEDVGDIQLVSDQGIKIKVLEIDSNTSYHQPVSLAYRITPSDTSYDRSNYAVLYSGELTLKYDANVSNAAADTLTVLYIPYGIDYYYSYDDNFKDTWDDDLSDRDCIVLGGRVDTSAKTITVPFSKTGFGTYAVFNVSREFTDLVNGNDFLWARNYVLPLWAKGIMEKMGEDEDFGVSDSITREEFTAALINGMGIPLVTGLNSPFTDVPDDLELWDEAYEDHILTAARNGIIQGFPGDDGDYEFRPRDNLTREQAATIIARAANLKISDDEDSVKAAIEKAFSDSYDDFGPWAAPYVYAAYKAGFIQGVPNDDGKTFSFNPKDPLSRSEAAKLIYNLMKKQKKL